MIQNQQTIDTLKNAIDNYAEDAAILECIDLYLKEIGCNDIGYVDNEIKGDKFRKDALQSLKPVLNKFYDIYINQYSDEDLVNQNINEHFFDSFTQNDLFWNHLNSIPAPDFTNRAETKDWRLALKIFKQGGSEYIGSFVETITKDQDTVLAEAVAQSFAQRWIDDHFESLFEDYVSKAQKDYYYHIEDYFVDNINTIYPAFKADFEGKQQEEKEKLLENLKQDLSYNGYPNDDVNYVVSEASKNSNILNVYVNDGANVVLESFFPERIKSQEELTQNVLEDIQEGAFYVHVDLYMKNKLNAIAELSDGYLAAYNVLHNRDKMENLVDQMSRELYSEYTKRLDEHPETGFDDFLNEINLIKEVLSEFNENKAREYYLNRFIGIAQGLGYSDVVLQPFMQGRYEIELYNFAKLGAREETVRDCLEKYVEETGRN